MRPIWYSSALLIIALAGPPRSGRLLPIEAVLGVKLAVAAGVGGRGPARP